MRAALLSAVLGLVVGLGVVGGPCEAVPAAPGEARVVDYFEQVGVDTPTPRFGWVVNDPARGARQSAYEIVVASSEGGLAGGKDVVWDSGKVASSRQYGVEYAGGAWRRPVVTGGRCGRGTGRIGCRRGVRGGGL